MELRKLLEKQWVKRNGEIDHKMVDYCLKSSIYVQSGDEFINCGDSKPTIDKTMWYDDETDGPTVNFDSFKRYNQSNFPRTLEEMKMGRDGRQVYIVDNYYLRAGETTTLLKSVRVADLDYDRVDGNPRLATDEEIRLINEAILKARADYEKRLERYWKRYSNKVRAEGYWVNR